MKSHKCSKYVLVLLEEELIKQGWQGPSISNCIEENSVKAQWAYK